LGGSRGRERAVKIKVVHANVSKGCAEKESEVFVFFDDFESMRMLAGEQMP
jgi:hypothetical protein